MSFPRCAHDGGFLHHSFVTTDGHPVYRCTREDSYNDEGRFYIFTGKGPIEVTPVAHRSKGGTSWTIDFIDTERRRLREETARINDELDKRAKLYRNNMAKLFETAKYHEKYGADDDDS